MFESFIILSRGTKWHYRKMIFLFGFFCVVSKIMKFRMVKKNPFFFSISYLSMHSPRESARQFYFYVSLNHTDSTNYRRNSIIPVIDTLFEKMICEILSDFLKKNGFLYPMMYSILWKSGAPTYVT